MAGPRILDLVTVEVSFDAPLTLEPDWLPLGSIVVSIETDEGFGVNAGLFPVSTATVVVSNLDPVTYLQFFDPRQRYRGIHIRVVELQDSTPIFRGRVEKVDYAYTGARYAAFASLKCVGGLGAIKDGSISNLDLFPTEVDGFVGVASTEDAVATILGQVLPGWTVNGLFTQQLVKAPDNLDTTQGLLELLQRILETEGAALSHEAETNTFELAGRWTPFDLLDPIITPDPDVTLVGHTPPYTASSPREVPFLRGSLVWNDPDDDYANEATARSAYLPYDPVTVADIPAGWPAVNFSRTELPTIRRGWVQANAEHWLAVKSKPNATPASVSVLVATAQGFMQGHVVAPLHGALGTRRHDVTVDAPGFATPSTFRCVLVGRKHSIDHRRWIVTYGYESLDRYALAYPYDPLRLVIVDGDADHGIDSGAIWAP